MTTEVTLSMLASPEAHTVHHIMRSQNAVAWVPALDGWFVTGRQPAVAALRDAATFTVDDDRFSTAVVVGRSMLSTDGDEHARHRAPFVPPFARPVVDRDHTDALTAAADRLVSGLGDRGRAELRTELVGPLAVKVIADVLGLVDEDQTPVDTAILLAWYRAIVSGVDRVSTAQPVEAVTHTSLAALRKCVDATSTVAGPLGHAGDALSPDEVFSNAAVLLFGAIETNEGMTANAIWHLLTNPGVLDVVRGDRDRVGDLIEESLRLEPAAAVVDRYATCDTNLGKASIQAGDFVRISLAAANRDPDVFAEPDRFDIDRVNARQHLAFVQGPHACLGLHLARAQTAAAIHAVLDQLPGLQLDLASSTPPAGLIFRKPQRLLAHWRGR